MKWFAVWGRVVVVGMLMLSGCGAEPAADPATVAEIHGLLHKTFDQPDQTLVLEPTIISGEFAVVDWVQGEFGGRALLRDDPSRGWSVWVCAGDHLKTAKGMIASGVSEADASLMAAQLAKGEARLPKESLAKMSAFLQVMNMQDGSEHPAPAH
ncbi:MAG: copper uptake system-associated protein [Hyphomonadaceae bacterium]